MSDTTEQDIRELRLELARMRAQSDATRELLLQTIILLDMTLRGFSDRTVHCITDTSGENREMMRFAYQIRAAAQHGEPDG